MWDLEVGIWQLIPISFRGTIPRNFTHNFWSGDSRTLREKERTGMIKSAAARTSQTELDPIDRLEEKVKRLVDLIAQMRAEQAKSATDSARLAQEITTLRGRLAEAESAASEISALRDERELIRTRVADMLEQLEAI